MSRFFGILWGRGDKGKTVSGSANAPVKAYAQTWSVRAIAEAYEGPAPKSSYGQTENHLGLGLVALCDSGGKAYGGVQAKGAAFYLFEGSESAALALTGQHGPMPQAAALEALAERFAKRARAIRNPKLKEMQA